MNAFPSGVIGLDAHITDKALEAHAFSIRNVDQVRRVLSPEELEAQSNEVGGLIHDTRRDVDIDVQLVSRWADRLKVALPELKSGIDILFLVRNKEGP